MNKNNTHVSNVLVIGTGGAGLRAAIEAKKEGVDVIVLGKRLKEDAHTVFCLLYTSPSPRDGLLSRMPSSA